MARVAILVNDSLPMQARSILADFEVHEGTAEDADIARCEVLICWPLRAMKDNLFDRMPNLKMVQTLSAGVDTLDFTKLPKGAQVFSNAGAYTENVAEHVWGILLGVAKGIHLRNQKSTPRRLRGKTLLVLGCGAIGSEVARLSKSLDITVIGVSRSFKMPELYAERLPMQKLAEAIPRADAIVVTLPLTNKTRGVVDYPLLTKAKEAVVVVNVGRGETVPEEDLVRWLKERPESRYATDVYWSEGGKESFATTAWELSNFAGTLHVSGLPLGEELAGAKVAAALNVQRFFESGDALNHVDVAEYMCENSHRSTKRLNTRGGGRAEQGLRNAKKEIRHRRIRGTKGPRTGHSTSTAVATHEDGPNEPHLRRPEACDELRHERTHPARFSRRSNGQGPRDGNQQSRRRSRNRHQEAGQRSVQDQGHRHQHRGRWRRPRAKEHLLDRNSRRKVEANSPINLAFGAKRLAVAKCRDFPIFKPGLFLPEVRLILRGRRRHRIRHSMNPKELSPASGGERVLSQSGVLRASGP